MRYLHLALACVCLATGAGCEHRRQPIKVTSEAAKDLRAVDLSHAKFAQDGDANGLAGLLHPLFLTHLPTGRTVDRTQILAFATSGASATERFQRRQEQVLIANETGVVIGIDQLEAPPSLAQRGERTRRYTNIYTRQNGRWQLLARHFHFLP